MEKAYLQMLAQIVLPAQILDYFRVVVVLRISSEIHISLDEKMLPELNNDIRPNGHFE